MAKKQTCCGVDLTLSQCRDKQREARADKLGSSFKIHLINRFCSNLYMWLRETFCIRMTNRKTIERAIPAHNKHI